MFFKLFECICVIKNTTNKLQVLQLFWWKVTKFNQKSDVYVRHKNVYVRHTFKDGWFKPQFSVFILKHVDTHPKLCVP